MVVLDLPTSMKGDKKYEGGYSKKMVRSGDNDITIMDAQRWLIEKSSLVDGALSTETMGVAYAWKECNLGDKVVYSPGGQRQENLGKKEMGEAIQSQAAAVRELKEGQGLGNKDPEVVEAVQELLRLKSLLVEAQV